MSSVAADDDLHGPANSPPRRDVAYMLEYGTTYLHFVGYVASYWFRPPGGWMPLGLVG